MTIKHNFVSGKSDGSDASLVKPSNWNDTHGGTIDVLDLTVFSCTGDQTLNLGLNGDCVVLVSTSGGPSGSASCSVWLPQAASAFTAGGSRSGVSRKITILRKDSSTGIVHIYKNPLDPPTVLINYQNEYQLVNQLQAADLITDGSLWWAKSSN